MRITYDVLEQADISQVINMAHGGETRNHAAERPLLPARFNAEMLSEWTSHLGGLGVVAHCIEAAQETPPRVAGFALGQWLSASRQGIINALTVSPDFDERRINLGLTRRILQEFRFFECREVISFHETMDHSADVIEQNTGFTVMRDGLYRIATRSIRPH